MSLEKCRCDQRQCRSKKHSDFFNPTSSEVARFSLQGLHYSINLRSLAVWVVQHCVNLSATLPKRACCLSPMGYLFRYLTQTIYLVTQNRHLMGIKHNIRPLYALLSASL